jgi:hypothetical protein
MIHYEAPEGGYPLTLYNRRLSDYINTLAAAGFAVERLVEETDKETLEREGSCTSRWRGWRNSDETKRDSKPYPGNSITVRNDCCVESWI